MPQLVTLQFTMPGGPFAPQTYALDASVNEQHGVQAEVTEHKVETGSAVDDYIRPKPRKLTIEGVVTNTPMPLAVAALASGVTSRTATTQVQTSRAALPPTGQTAGVSLFLDQQPVNLKTLLFSAQFDRVRDVYNGLVSAALAGALFTVTTTLASYDNMALVSLSAPRNAQSGSAIRVTLDFQQLTFATVQTVAAPAPKIAKKKLGQKAPEVADNSSRKPRSLLLAGINAGRSAIGLPAAE